MQEAKELENRRDIPFPPIVCRRMPFCHPESECLKDLMSDSSLRSGMAV